MQDFQFPQSTDFPVQCVRLLTFGVESPSPYALFLFCPITKLLILSDSINKKKKKKKLEKGKSASLTKDIT